jgi:hypothetical protein
MTRLLDESEPPAVVEGAHATAASSVDAGSGPPSSPTFALVDGLPALTDLIERLVNVNARPNCCVIIDDVGLLADVGVALVDVLRFITDCRSRFSSRGSVVLLCHGLATDPEDDGVFDSVEEMPSIDDDGSVARHLRYTADVALGVTGLKSGYSREVHGQMTAEEVRPGCALPTTTVLQFKTRDNGVTFFAPGTSSAVL